MEISEFWESIDSRVDWFLTGIISLLVLNLAFPAYMAWSYMNIQDFHTKHNISPSEVFVEKAKMLEDLPTMDDIEVPPPEGLQSLPEQYVQLKTTDLFVPTGAQGIGAPIAPNGDEDTDSETGPRERKLPPISGYEIVGRITGKGDVKAGVIRQLGDDGQNERKTFVAREGEYLENTDVKILDISDTMIRLSKPEHRATTLQFEIDKISEKIRQSIEIQ